MSSISPIDTYIDIQNSLRSSDLDVLESHIASSLLIKRQLLLQNYDNDVHSINAAWGLIGSPFHLSLPALIEAYNITDADSIGYRFIGNLKNLKARIIIAMDLALYFISESGKWKYESAIWQPDDFVYYPSVENALIKHKESQRDEDEDEEDDFNDDDNEDDNEDDYWDSYDQQLEKEVQNLSIKDRQHTQDIHQHTLDIHDEHDDYFERMAENPVPSTILDNTDESEANQILALKNIIQGTFESAIIPPNKSSRGHSDNIIEDPKKLDYLIDEVVKLAGSLGMEKQDLLDYITAKVFSI